MHFIDVRKKEFYTETWKLLVCFAFWKNCINMEI